MKIHKQRGYTLVEMVVVLAIVGLLAALTVAIFNLQKVNNFNKQSEELVSALRKAQSQAATGENNDEYGISFSSGSYTTYRIDTATATQTSIATTTVSGTTISTSITPSASQVTFLRVSGQTKNATSATITMTLNGTSRTKVIIVNAAGQIYVQ